MVVCLFAQRESSARFPFPFPCGLPKANIPLLLFWGPCIPSFRALTSRSPDSACIPPCDSLAGSDAPSLAISALAFPLSCHVHTLALQPRVHSWLCGTWVTSYCSPVESVEGSLLLTSCSARSRDCASCLSATKCDEVALVTPRDDARFHHVAQPGSQQLF